MGRRRSRPRRGASGESPAAAPRVLPDGATSVFVESQQQGVPAGVHPEGAAVLRSFHELQRLAAVRGDSDKTTKQVTPQAAGRAYGGPLLDPNR